MTVEAEIISQPYSGQYIERIYDSASACNSQSWTFIKFTDEDYTEWCGHFRDAPRQVSISTIRNTILVLTSDYLYQLDKSTADLIELEDQPPYHNLTVAPNGNFILADYYHLEKVATSIKNKEAIDSPINMDTIRFEKWVDNKLQFTCDEFLNWDRHLVMTYDSETDKVDIINAT